MPSSSERKAIKQAKSIKNIYIHKINNLLKIMGSGNCSFSSLGKTRKNLLMDSYQELAFQRKQNNKDAARKARMRKKIYIQMLQQCIIDLQQLKKQGDYLERTSNEVLSLMNNSEPIKQEDEIGQYLIQNYHQLDANKVRKQSSKITMDAEKGCQFNKILMEIQMISFPQHFKTERLNECAKKNETARLFTKMQEVEQQLPEVFMDLKNICSEQTSLLVTSAANKSQSNFDPYFGKTLMQQYYSKTLCKKNITGIETHKYLDLLSRMKNYDCKSQKIQESDSLISE